MSRRSQASDEASYRFQLRHGAPPALPMEVKTSNGGAPVRIDRDVQLPQPVGPLAVPVTTWPGPGRDLPTAWAATSPA
jgi:hypothetical protein